MSSAVVYSSEDGEQRSLMADTGDIRTLLQRTPFFLTDFIEIQLYKIGCIEVVWATWFR